jgi:hypothetical protein
MARNRNRNYRKNVRTRLLPAWLAVAVVVAAGLGFTYLWLGTRCDAIGQRIKKLEQEKIAVRRLVVNEEYKWSNLTTFENISRLLKKHNLQMDWPKQTDVVRVRRPVAALALSDSPDSSAFVRN